MTVLSRLGQHVEDPPQLPRLGVVAPDVPGHVFLALRVVAAVVRVAHDHHPVHHDRGRAGRDVAGVEDAPIGVHGVVAHAQVQVDNAAEAKEGEEVARVGVESDEVVARGHHEDGGTPLDLGVGHALPVVLAGGGLVARVVPLAPHPQRLARRRIDGHHAPALSRHVVEPVAHFDRRAPIDVVGFRAVVLGGPTPGHFKLAHVLGRDLIERRVATAPLVAAPVAPLALFRPLRLREYGRCGEGQHGEESRRRERGPAERALGHCLLLHLMTILPRASGVSGNSWPPVGMSFRERM